MANAPGDGAQTIEMKKFIEMAVKNFGLPQFQRPPTWNWEHQRDLLQSIYQKVPIGSVMIWEYNRDITPDLEYRRLDQINQNKQDITHLILDGQQRMRFLTLLWLSTRDKTYCNQLRKNSGHIYFYPEGDPASRNEIVHFRIEKERSERYDVKQKWVSLQYLLSNLQSKNNLNTYFADEPGEPNSITQKLDTMYENYNNYVISYHNLGPDIDYATALLVYERVNLAGKRLSALDVAEAVYISKYPDLFKRIKQETERYRKKGFGSDFSFSRKRILNNISVELYRSITARPKQLSVFNPKTRQNRELKKSHVKKAFDETIKAFNYLLGILENEFSLAGDKPITTNYPLIIAAAFLRKNKGKLDGAQRGKMCRWLALSIYANRYAGKGTNTKMDEDLEIVYSQADPWEDLYKNMEGKKSFSVYDFGEFSTHDPIETKNTWLGQLYIAKMNWNNALDFISLQSISSPGKREWHHIFPQSLWKEGSPLLETKDLRENKEVYMNHFANKSYISKSSNAHIGGTEPLTYLTTIDSKRRTVLEPHDLDDPRFFKQEEYKQFLERRRKKITRSMNDFLDKLEEGGSRPERSSAPKPKKIFETNDRETQFVEWKETYCCATEGEHLGRKLKVLEINLMKEICGMANSGGGHIFLGADDDGNPQGMARDYSVISSRGTVDFEFLQGVILRQISTTLVVLSKPRFRLRKMINITPFKTSGKELVSIQVPYWPSEDVAVKTKVGKKNPVWIATRYYRDGAHKDPEETAIYKLSSDGEWIESLS